MSNINILNLEVAINLDGSEYIPLVQGLGSDANTKRATAELIANTATAWLPTSASLTAGAGISLSPSGDLSANPTISLTISGLTAKTAMAVADSFAINDVAGGNVPKQTTFPNAMKALTGLAALGAPDLTNDYLIINRASDGETYKINPSSLSLASGNVPAGGTTAQVLQKASSTNYDTTWGAVTGSGNVVLAVSPSLTTPTMSAPTITSAALFTGSALGGGRYLEKYTGFADGANVNWTVSEGAAPPGIGGNFKHTYFGYNIAPNALREVGGDEPAIALAFAVNQHEHIDGPYGNLGVHIVDTDGLVRPAWSFEWPHSGDGETSQGYFRGDTYAIITWVGDAYAQFAPSVVSWGPNQYQQFPTNNIAICYQLNSIGGLSPLWFIDNFDRARLNTLSYFQGVPTLGILGAVSLMDILALTPPAGSTAINLVAGSVTGDIILSSFIGTATGEVLAKVANNDSATAAARTVIDVVRARSGSDAYFRCTNSGDVANWSLGYDGSDSGAFVVSRSDVLGTNNVLRITSAGVTQIGVTSVSPMTTGGASLGTSSLMWSDLFLASAGVINFNNGNYTLTHSAGALTASAAFIGSANIWAGAVSSALQTLTGASDGMRTSAANATQIAGENTTSSSATAGGLVGMYSNDGAAMASGDRLGGIRMGGSSSASALRNSAGMFAFASEAWADGSAYGSRLEFQNTTNGATALSTKLILSNAGLLAFGATLANTVPALKPSSTTLIARLGDDSGDCDFTAANITASATLRINAAPSAIGTGAKTISNGADSSTNFGHYISLNMNGTVYYIPASSVAPT